ncbi:hypothetical protein [Butyrivibrio sp. AE3004]|uniref:hypothetical protein n=1 Tax=Butyrivibrio sp. AE3004 TaxID=1506994 RepID=UPI0004948342|nr:hypothetical protein [Butyrivibrio sp. AE3004]
MTKNQETEVAATIHSAAVAAAAVAGFTSQIPLADSVLLSAIEIPMVINIGRIFDRELSSSTAWSLIISQVGTLSGRAISQVAIGWFPGVGNITNAVTAAGVVEALGWAIADYFDFNPESV